MKQLFLYVASMILLPMPVLATIIDGWDITAQSAEIRPLFSLSQEVETYTGDIVLHEITHEPKEGFVYIAVPTAVSRKETDSKFLSESVLLNVNEESFSRVKDDSFLIDYGMKPFPHMNIKLGTHKGVYLFEIPEESVLNEMFLSYQNQKIKLSVEQK